MAAWAYQHYREVPQGDEEAVARDVFEAMFNESEAEAVRRRGIESSALQMLIPQHNAHLRDVFGAHGYTAENPHIHGSLRQLRTAVRHSGIGCNPCAFGLPTLVEVRSETGYVIFDQGTVSMHTVLNFWDGSKLIKSFALLEGRTRCNYGPVYRGVEVIQTRNGRYIASESIVAVKKIERERLESHLRRNEGHLNEDPIKEIAALQYVDKQTAGAGCPHVLPLIMAGMTEKAIFTITPFCDRGDLFAVVERYQRLTSVQAAPFFKQIVAGLFHLHLLGLSHHDLSLENVLWFASPDSKRPKAYIMDLGMAVKTSGPTTTRILSRRITNRAHQPLNTPAISYFSVPVAPATRWPCRCGKPDYLAPEFLRPFNSFDLFAPDVFSLGVILYIMLIGVPPFDINRAFELRIPYENLIENDECFDFIKRRRLSELLLAWDIHLPNDAIDLLQRLLDPEPTTRITIPEIWYHPWFIRHQ